MKSAWEIEGIKKHDGLTKDMEADVCVVGGGLAGAWCAYLLSKEGRKVVLLEKDELGRAATLYTTALITQVIDTDLKSLMSMFGEKLARQSWQAGADAIGLIESTVNTEAIECDFKRLPLYTYARNKSELEKLKNEASLARQLDFDSSIKPMPIEGFKNVGAMETGAQAKYHPIKFLKGIIEKAEENGAKIFEQTEVVEVSGRTKMHVLTKSGFSVEAKDVALATYEPLNNPKETHWKKGMYTTYIYALEFERGTLPEMIAEDLSNPYHYFRIDEAGDKSTMLVGGEDHREELKFLEKQSFRALKDYIDSTFPNLDYKLTHKWSGGILEPSDGLPLIGRLAPHLYVASAFSGNGMTYSAISGKIVSELIMERGSVYEELYNPKRHILGRPLIFKARDYTEEFFGGAVKNLFK